MKTETWNPIGVITLFRREMRRVFRLPVQTVISPWISALLYILVFGSVVGSRIQPIHGVSYIGFVLPGILLMSVLNAAFMAGSSGIYFHRFIKTIEEILTAPISYAEMISAFVFAAIVRGLIVGVGIYGMALLFHAANMVHPFQLVMAVVGISALFSLLGIIVGLWADGFEQLSVLQTFIITPLTFLGGMFYSKTMLPHWAQIITDYNPFFHFIDTVRYGMIGVRDGSALAGWATIYGLALLSAIIAWSLFRRGYKLRS